MAKAQYLSTISDTAIEFITSEKGVKSRVGVYYGQRVNGRKVLQLVKAGAHIDATKAEVVYLHRIVKKSGEVIKVRYYELKDVLVYNRINHALYHRLLLQYSRMKLRDTATFGLPAEQAALNDRDIDRILELSRGELICRNGVSEYKLLG